MSFKDRFKKLFGYYSEPESSEQNFISQENPNDEESSEKNCIDIEKEKPESLKEKIKTVKNMVAEKAAGDNEAKEKDEDEPPVQFEEIREMIDHVIEPRERTFKNYVNIGFWKEKRDLYRKLREKEKEDMNIYQVLSDGARPSIEYYVLTILSCIISTIGLIQGATAIIIGAMIVAPLMTPILAFSLGVIWGDLWLIRTSVSSIIKGIFWGITISAIIAFFVPIPSFSQEIISRTHPTLFDVLVALASGIVGAYGYANKKISNTLIGIAIAVALMPPLCTIGIGIGTKDLMVATGAGILFLINLVSIGLAGAVVFWSMKIHPVLADKGKVTKRALYQILISLVILAGISIPVGIFMYRAYRVSEAENSVRTTIEKEFINQKIFRIELEKTENNYVINLILTGFEAPDRDRINETKDMLVKIHTDIREINISHILSSSITD